MFGTSSAEPTLVSRELEGDLANLPLQLPAPYATDEVDQLASQV